MAEEQTVELDSSIDPSAVANTAMGQMRQSSSFKVELNDQSADNGFFRVESSMNTAVIDRMPDKLEVRISGNPRVVEDVAEAVRQQYSDPRTSRNTKNETTEENTVEPPNSNATPNGNFEASKSAIEMTLQQDGSLTINMNGETIEVDTLMGAFIPKGYASGEQPIIYIDDDATLTQGTIDDILEELRTELRQQTR